MSAETPDPMDRVDPELRGPLEAYLKLAPPMDDASGIEAAPWPAPVEAAAG